MHKTIYIVFHEDKIWRRIWVTLLNYSIFYLSFCVSFYQKFSWEMEISMFFFIDWMQGVDLTTVSHSFSAARIESSPKLSINQWNELHDPNSDSIVTFTQEASTKIQRIRLNFVCTTLHSQNWKYLHADVPPFVYKIVNFTLFLFCNWSSRDQSQRMFKQKL